MYGVAGVDLNYSEVVVYDEARVVPSYLIVYSLSAQAATPDKERVLAETNTAHSITSKDQSELHSWSPRKEKAVWTGLWSPKFVPNEPERVLNSSAILEVRFS